MAAPQQRPIGVEEGGADRNAPSETPWRASARATDSILPTSASLRGSAGDICSVGVMSTAADGTYTTTVGSQKVDLPLVALSDELTIALLICVDMGVSFAETAGRELAELMGPAQPEIIVSVATMGIPLAIEASRALGLDDYVILHKTPKIHLGETWAEPVYSITTDQPQRLRMDPARAGAVRGRRVAVVDDVVSTGASLAAALRLVRRLDAEPVVIGTLMTEGGGWKRGAGRGCGPGPHPRRHAVVPSRRLGRPGRGLGLIPPITRPRAAPPPGAAVPAHRPASARSGWPGSDTPARRRPCPRRC